MSLEGISEGYFLLPFSLLWIKLNFHEELNLLSRINLIGRYQVVADKVLYEEIMMNDDNLEFNLLSSSLLKLSEVCTS